MKLGFIVLSKNNKESIETKLTEHFKKANNLLDIMTYESIYNCSDTVTAQGTPCDKLIVFNASGEHLADKEAICECISEIADSLRGNQTICICDRGKALEDDLSEIILNQSCITYNNLEKFTNSNCYCAVFGKSTSKVSSSVEQQVETLIKNKKQEKEVTPTVVEDDETVPVVEDEQQPPEESSKKGGFFSKIFNKKSKTIEQPVVDETSTVEDTEVQTPVVEDSVTVPEDPTHFEEVPPVDDLFGEPSPLKSTIPEPISVVEEPEEDEEPQPVPVVEEPETPKFKQKIRESNNKPKGFFKRNKVVEEPAEEEEQVVFNNEPESESIVEQPEQSVSKGFFKHNKRQQQTENEDLTQPSKSVKSRESLPLLSKSKVVLVTGCEGSGVSTVTSSLAFSAALNGADVLIIDFDIINRTQSCIFGDYLNQESISSSGLSAALKAPYRLMDLVSNPIEKIDVLGISIAEDNQGLDELFTLENINALILEGLNNYNLVLCDIPWSLINEYPELASISNCIEYVTSNDVVSIIKAINQFSIDNFKQENKHNLVTNKMSFVLNKFAPSNTYEKKKITAKNFSEIIADLADIESYVNIEVAGALPYEPIVGNQASENLPASALNATVEEGCYRILLTVR